MSQPTRRAEDRGPLRVYIAARSEDRYAARDLRLTLQGQGIACTSQWLDVEDLRPGRAGAGPGLMCIEDLLSSHVLLALNPLKSHRAGTGGWHIEVGVAIGRLPIVLMGDRENDFHWLPYVHLVSIDTPPTRLGETLNLAALLGTPIPADALSPAQFGVPDPAGARAPSTRSGAEG